MQKELDYIMDMWDRRLPINPVFFAYYSKITLKPLSLLKGNIGLDTTAIALIEEGNHVIYVNTKDQINRQKFCVAHSIGHYMLGHVKEGKHKEDTLINYLTSVHDEQEKMANLFAIRLLVPKEALDVIVERGGVTEIRELANVFDVSEELIYYRLKDLGVI